MTASSVAATPPTVTPVSPVKPYPLRVTVAPAGPLAGTIELMEQKGSVSSGVTAADATEAAPVPAALVAVTLKV